MLRQQPVMRAEPMRQERVRGLALDRGDAEDRAEDPLPLESASRKRRFPELICRRAPTLIEEIQQREGHSAHAARSHGDVLADLHAPQVIGPSATSTSTATSDVPVSTWPSSRARSRRTQTRRPEANLHVWIIDIDWTRPLGDHVSY